MVSCILALFDLIKSVLFPFFSGGSREIQVFSDIEKFRLETGCSSVMLARAAEWNLSIFSSQGKVEITEIIKNFLKLAVEFNIPFSNTKYTIQCILRELQDTPFGKKFLATQITEELW
jgi:tRNA-dihydrouridine synthase 2